MKQHIIKEVPEDIEYRVIQQGSSKCFQPQYRSNDSKLFIRKWKNFTKRAYDQREGESYEANETFSSLEEANAHIDAYILSKTTTIYYRTND